MKKCKNDNYYKSFKKESLVNNDKTVDNLFLLMYLK